MYMCVSADGMLEGRGAWKGVRGDIVCLTLCSILPTLSPSTLSNGTAVMSMQEILAALSLK